MVCAKANSGNIVRFVSLALCVFPASIQVRRVCWLPGLHLPTVRGKLRVSRNPHGRAATRERAGALGPSSPVPTQGSLSLTAHQLGLSSRLPSSPSPGLSSGELQGAVRRMVGSYNRKEKEEPKFEMLSISAH